MEREVGGGIGMGNTCKSMADSFQCMTKPTTIKKKKTKYSDYTHYQVSQEKGGTAHSHSWAPGGGAKCRLCFVGSECMFLTVNVCEMGSHIRIACWSLLARL